ncbi:outer membrane lipoprotein carrier protein LolA [Myxococcota bacterium]|nr:outer membrane lipoprotein carrier protein LolA [Myxococcota bacterium]MBU1900232.1 outer membrane lipoprotein carrier protein LolA [Myxococcota bacterium]
MSALLLCLALFSPASAPTSAPIPPALDAQIEARLAALQIPQAVEARFTQTKTSRLFKRPQRAEGRLRMARPDQLRWDYHAPYRMSLIKDQRRVTLVYPDLNQQQRFDLDQDPQMRAVFEMILFFHSAGLSHVRDRFELTPLGADGVALSPKGEGAKLLRRAEAHVDVTRGVLRALRLVEPDGDETLIEFEGARVNPTLAPDWLTP